MQRLGFIVAAALLAVPLLAQNQPKFGEKLEVNAVLVDAVVTDHTGHQILGLDKNDFIVRENGVPQQIESIDYFTNRRLLTAPEQQAAFKVERVREERYFIFFFDKPASGSDYFDRLRLARQAVKNFVTTEMLPSDRVAIVGDDVRLKVYSDFTSDKNQLFAALDDSTRYGRGLMNRAGCGPDSIMANIDIDTMVNHTGTVMEALRVLGDAVRPIHARKNLLIFSPGILEIGETVQHGLIMNTSRYYDPMIRALNTANVSVYGMNLNDPSPNEPPFVHQNLERIARDTSGDYYRNVVGFDSIVKRIENQNNGYYLITYYAHHPRGAGGYQKIDVSLKNPEFRVKAREGYAF